jgi:hypothetical protein
MNYLQELAQKRKFVRAETSVYSHRITLDMARESSLAYIRTERGDIVLLRSWKGACFDINSGVVFHQFPIPDDGWEIVQEE